MDDNYILEVKTVQSSAFRILVEALKEILTDANLEFDESGVKVMAMDSSHTVLVHLKLNANNFESFFCKNKLILGINMINFFKLIKTMSNSDTLTLFVTEQGKILPRRATEVTVQQQRKLSKAIKRARILSLFPFIASNSI